MMAQLGNEATVSMGTGVNRRRVRLHPIYHALGQCRVSALKGFHALSCCDSTGHIFGKSKDVWWNIFEKASETILIASAELGIGNEPNAHVLSGCEEFICQLFSLKNQTLTESLELRWSQFPDLTSTTTHPRSNV